ncbi:DUF4132 domain-containing protein [Candidatus Sumerlaeota bacterium]|nr:DUF4132 domain-containing protein [Candidatus Sumerlaeota bacterium]
MNPQRPGDIDTGDYWGKGVQGDLETMAPWERSRWDRLIVHFSLAKGGKPTQKWLRKSMELLPPLEPAQVKEKLEYWKIFLQVKNDKDQQLKEPNATILKGMIWFCRNFENPGFIRLVSEYAALCLKKIPECGAVCLAAGNACITVLGAMSRQEAVIQLIKLKRSIKYSVPLRLIEKNLKSAATKQGMTVDDLAEITLPHYGFDSNGIRRENFGDVKLELRIAGMGVEWKWIPPSGKIQDGIPKDVKTKFAGEIASLKKEIKEVEKILPSQRDRIDQLMMSERTWRFDQWKKRYIAHPIVSDLSRRLIWNFNAEKERKSGMWRDFAMADFRGVPLELEENALVSLWHPIDAPLEEKKAWQDFILNRRITQPFRQAFREIYVLTEEEKKRMDHSNRFAAHILKQHQMAAVCRAFGWKYRLMGRFDSYSCPALEIPQHNMTVELEIKSPDPGNPVSPGGIFLYVITYKVSFKYSNGNRIPLENIPEKIFSEVMRNVDLLVSVSSIGRDPNWGMEGDSLIYRDYWTSCGSLKLLPSEEIRAVILEWIIPQLEIAQRCSVRGDYLHVRGNWKSYKIHIGCGRVMMEPENRHLQIEPDSGSLKKICDHLYIPIEGDSHLYLIVAKAFLLANDNMIDDPNILNQIKDY